MIVWKMSQQSMPNQQEQEDKITEQDVTVQYAERLEKGRIRIHLDNDETFVLYKKDARHLPLEVGERWKAAEYRELLEEILIPRAKKRAMHLLEKMDRTEAQLREKLQQNEYPICAIEEAISYVKGYHYVDDLRYACNYVRYRAQSKSRRILAMELSRKGVSREHIELALEAEYGEEDEVSKILKWIEKKQYDAGNADVKQRQKMYQFLLRKGFRSDDILRVL